MFLVVVVSRTVCRRMSAYAEHSSSTMKLSSERDPAPKSPNKSRRTLPVYVVSVLAVADVLAALDGLTPEFDELREASKRPFAKLKLAYPDPVACDIPDVKVLRHLSQLLSLRASAELALGRANGAFADVRVIQRLADVNRTEPFFDCGIYYCAIHGLALQTFWEDWVSGQWSDEQLNEFQSRFASVDMLAVFDNAMRGERAGVDFMVETLNGRQLLSH